MISHASMEAILEILTEKRYQNWNYPRFNTIVTKKL